MLREIADIERLENISVGQEFRQPIFEAGRYALRHPKKGYMEYIASAHPEDKSDKIKLILRSIARKWTDF